VVHDIEYQAGIAQAQLSGAAIAAVNMIVMMSHPLSLTRALHGCHGSTSVNV
jgi:hypothetical protein